MGLACRSTCGRCVGVPSPELNGTSSSVSFAMFGEEWDLLRPELLDVVDPSSFNFVLYTSLLAIKYEDKNIN